MEKRIVYLDDDEESIGNLGEVLKEVNYRIEIAKTSSGAEKLAAKVEPDLFIISMDIINSDPTALIQKIRRNKDFKDTPFVFISESFDEDTFYEEFKEADRTRSRFMKKPFKIEDFIDLVESSIGLPTPPKGAFPISIEGQRELIILKKENEELRSEASELKGKLGDYSKVQAIEKAQHLKEMQKEVEKFKKENETIEEELILLKNDLLKKNRDIEEKEKKLNELKNEKNSESAKMRTEIAEFQKSADEEKEKHKKAQNALREFYKPKLAKLEEKISVLESEIEQAKGMPEKLKEEIREKETQLNEAQKQLRKEKEIKEKLKKTLEEIS